VNRHSQQAQQPSTDLKTSRCAIYTRKSTEEGLDQDFNSLDAQRESAEAFINSQKNEGWVCLPERYDDGGFTGGNMDRPAMKRLMDDIRADKVDCIVVYKVDRLSRSLLDFARIMETLDQHGISFVSVTQQFNTTHSMGRLTLNILLSFAQFEREIISERTRDKMTAARKKGKWIGGIPVLGYNIDSKGRRLVVNEEEAFKVRAIFDLYLEHQSLLSTARILNSRGWTTKTWITKKGIERGGRLFDKNNLFRLLTNPVYIGKTYFKDVTYEGEHQGLLDADIWQNAQDLLSRNGRNGGRLVRNKYGALLKGLLYCAPCQSAMVHVCTTRNKATSYRYYVCSKAQKAGWDTCPTKSLPAAEIERFVIDRIRCIGQDSDLITETINAARGQIHQGIGKLEDEYRATQLELKRFAADVTKLVGGIDVGHNPTDNASTRLVELEDQIRVTRQRSEVLRKEITQKKKQFVDQEELTLALNRFDPVWESLSLQERTRLIHLLVERINYDGATGSLSIIFRPSGIKTLAQETANIGAEAKK